jgi:hypothetical protein
MVLSALVTQRPAVRALIPLWICASAPVFSDVTIRYQSDFKTSLPPQVNEQMAKGIEAAGKQTITRMKGGKAFTSGGAWNSITDFAKEQITLINAQRQTFATAPAS